MNDEIGYPICPWIEIRIPGLTEAEEEVVSMFMAHADGTLSWNDDTIEMLGRLLAYFMHEMLPDYTHTERAILFGRVMNEFEGALKLFDQKPAGHA